MIRFVTILVIIALCAGLASAEPVTKTFGTAPTLTAATAISKLNSEPQTFVDKDVLVTGKVVNMCQHKGCWLEIEAADSSRILCKSFGDKVTFSKDVLGQMIQLQGKLVIDKPKPAEEAPKADVKAAEAVKAEVAAEKPAADAPATAVADVKADVKEGRERSPTRLPGAEGHDPPRRRNRADRRSEVISFPAR